jgi:hypothetical protein
VSSRFSAEQAFSAAASFDISASTSFPFGSPHGIRIAVANSSVPMIRVFSRSRPTFETSGGLESGFILLLSVTASRLTELLKQPQFSPLKMEEQVAVIYAGVNAYLDPIPVDRVRAFEDGLLRLMRSQHADILDAIRDTRDLDEATAAKLKAAVDEYAKTFA